jgi:REP element-mobilizing transposase RayT
MLEKFQGKYRISSSRLQHWDYGWNASYFVTICTAGHKTSFGKITSGKMILSPIGHLAKDDWLTIPEHFKYIELDDFIIMPNHIHGILLFDKNNDGRYESPPLAGKARFRNPGKDTLSTVIGSYKSIVCRHAHLINPEFGWQDRFYESIIRCERAYQVISGYIRDNPLNWMKDKFYDELSMNDQSHS